MVAYIMTRFDGYAVTIALCFCVPEGVLSHDLLSISTSQLGFRIFAPRNLLWQQALLNLDLRQPNHLSKLTFCMKFCKRSACPIRIPLTRRISECIITMPLGLDFFASIFDLAFHRENAGCTNAKSSMTVPAMALEETLSEPDDLVDTEGRVEMLELEAGESKN